MLWQFFSAESTDALPAITAENCSVHWFPTSWNCGTPTYCTPGRPGRFVVPGLSMGADEMASSVGLANAFAAFLYCGISYVDWRVPGGSAAQPPGICEPASLRYCGPVANETYFQARSCLLVVFGMASAHDHSQPELGVSFVGAAA